MSEKYVVRLTPEERGQLEAVVSKGRHAAYRIRHAHILLTSDSNGPSWSDEAIAQAVGCHAHAVHDVRKRFVLEGLERAMGRKTPTRFPRERVLDGRAEARLIALSQTPPPDGRTRWTLRLLADRLVELHVVGGICHETVRRTLKKMSSSHGSRRAGAFPA